MKKVLKKLFLCVMAFCLFMQMNMVETQAATKVVTDCFTFRFRQCSFGYQFHTWGNQYLIFQLAGNFPGQCLQASIVIGEQLRCV